MSRLSNCWLARQPATSAATATAPGSFPIRTLRSDFPGRRGAHQNHGVFIGDGAAGAPRQPAVAVEPPEERVGVEQKAQSALPGVQFFGGQRLEKSVRDTSVTAHDAETAARPVSVDGHEPHHRRLTACDDDLLARGRLFHEARQVGFRRMN